MNIIFLGTNALFKERVRMLPTSSVVFATNYKDVVRLCKQQAATDPDNNYSVVLYEKHSINEDITAITYLRKKIPMGYLILMADSINETERTSYLSCGINDTLLSNASVQEIVQKLDFI